MFIGFLWMVVWLILNSFSTAFVFIALAGDDGSLLSYVIYGFAIAFLVFMTYQAWRFYLKSDQAEKNMSYTWKDFGMTLLQLGGLLLFNLVISYFMSLSGMETTANQATLESVIEPDITVMGIIAYGFVLIIAAPVVEEVVFRGIGVTRILPDKPHVIGLITSVLFGFLHQPTDIISFVLYFGIGFILHLVYLRRHQLIDGILLHGMNNLISYLLIIYSFV